MSMAAVRDDNDTPILWLPHAYVPYGKQVVYWVRRALVGTPAERRAIVKDSPLLFALVYFSHALQSAETGWEKSLCQMHIDMFEEAKQWRYRWGPAQYRVAWVGPREVGKSTICRILLTWALACGWRKSALLFSNAGTRARQQLQNTKREFRTNELLRLDYPELCTPGDMEVDNAHEYISAGGHAIGANGFDESVLGYQTLNMRPQLIFCDDIEPTGAKYSTGSIGKRLRVLMEQVFPMNLNACVILIGTVTRYGAIMHQVVQSAAGGMKAQWIVDEHIDCRYYPGVVIDPTTGREDSLWPNRWDYQSYIQEQRHTDLFLLSMMNQPSSANKGFWSPKDYKYNPSWLIETQVLSIDPAVKSAEVNDPTGVSIIGFDAGKQRACVQWAEAVRLDPDGMRKLVAFLLNKHPLITHVLIEDNNGGDYVVRQLVPVIPRHVIVVPKFESPSKLDRIREAHDWYQLGWVWHMPGLLALEEQQRTYPDVDHDDIVDSVAKGLWFHLRHRPLPVPR